MLFRPTTLIDVPADVTAPAPDRVFNAGISAIIATELPVIAAVVASRAPARAVLGLDYYMFSRPGVPVHLDEALATPSGRLAALIHPKGLGGA